MQQWAEIKDPKTDESLYINLKTGLLIRNPPSQDKILSINENQWWELYDSRSSKYYYYNAVTKKTVWYRPENVHIIPLAEFQIECKMNNGCTNRKEISTQTLMDPIYDLPPDVSTPSDNLKSYKFNSEKSSAHLPNSAQMKQRSVENLCSTRLDDGDSSYGSLEGAISSIPKHMQSPNSLNTPNKMRQFPRTNPRSRNTSSVLINPPVVNVTSPPNTQNSHHPDDTSISQFNDNSTILSPPNPNVAPIPPPHGLPALPPVAGRNLIRNKNRLQEANPRPLSMVNISNKTESFSSNDSWKSNSQKSTSNLQDDGDIMKLPEAQPASIDVGLDGHRFVSLPGTGARGIGGGAPPPPPGSGDRIMSLDLAWCQLDPIENGLMTRSVSVPNLLLWTKNPISKPLLLSTELSMKKLSIENFKQLLIFMGDKTSRSDKEKLDLMIVQRGWQYPKLRDEIFMQIMKQLVQNPSLNSITVGWELLCVCLSFFPPSTKMHPFVESFIDKHVETLPSAASLSENAEEEDEENFMEERKCPKWFPAEKDAAEVLPVLVDIVYCSIRMAQKRLKRIKQSGAKKGTQNVTEEELKCEKDSILSPGLFGSSLEDIMSQQKKTHPELRIPWIQDVLSCSVLRLNGQYTEGIFRIPGDLDRVHHLKGLCESQKQNFNAEKEIDDPNVPASLLKLWLRELLDPVVPEYLYKRCLDVHSSIEDSLNVIEQLPDINKDCLKHLVCFLQKFTLPECIEQTKMDVPNLAMVMAPNILRSTATNPETIYEEARPQMYFLSNLIRKLDARDFDKCFD